MIQREHLSNFDSELQEISEPTVIMTDGAHYVFDLLQELQKISYASGLADLSDDIGRLIEIHRR